jgi:uncharacterized membrane protein YheB (UPF0754 family)
LNPLDIVVSLHSFFMHWYNYLVTILLSAFTGWITTWIAIKMLFHPRYPINILGYRLQGIFPKNQRKIAEKLGQVVGTELLSFSDIQQKITSTENLDKLKPEIEKHIDAFLNHKLKDVFPILSKFIGVKTTNQLKEAFMKELETMFPTLMHSYMDHLQHDMNLEQIVIDKVAGFSSEKLEDILISITKKEFQFLEVVGGVFGLLIGIIQVVFNMLTH